MWATHAFEGSEANWSSAIHCKPGQVEPAYIECGNGAAAMQVSQGNLFELGPTVEPAYIKCGNGAAAMQVSQGNLFELGPTL